YCAPYLGCPAHTLVYAFNGHLKLDPASPGPRDLQSSSASSAGISLSGVAGELQMRALMALRVGGGQLPPRIKEHQPLTSKLPRPTLRRAVRMLELLGELRRDVEGSRRKANAVVRNLAHHRHRRWTRRFHFAHDTSGLKAELSVEFPRQLL